MKTSILDKIAFFLFFVLLTVATLCFGLKSSGTISLRQETSPYELKSFRVKQLDDKVYVNWLAISTHDNYYFALERSTDGENYSVIELKKGFCSPGGQKLQYSFIDEEILVSEKIWYRIRLHEIQATDITHKKAILSKEDMFGQNENALVVIKNTPKISFN
jgi:hypothetical protein